MQAKGLYQKRTMKTGSIYLWQAFRQLRNEMIHSLRNVRRNLLYQEN